MTKSPSRRETGAIFLALMLILLVTGSTVLLAALNNRQTATASQQAELRREMELAKQALLAYAGTVAANFGDGPGHLPCPDLDNTGIPQTNCDPTTEYMGRLPQYVPLQTLNASGDPQRFYLSRAYADRDQQFWYAVSPEYLQTDAGGLQANSNVSASLSVDGASDIVAVIIAPGEALDGQDRVSGGPEYVQYLEGGNGASYQFWTSYAANPSVFNDVVLPITRSELWSIALPEVAKAIKVRLNAYHGGSCGYPRAWINPTTCAFSFSPTYPIAITNFRTVMNSTTGSPPAPTWLMSTSASITGEQNWMGQLSSYSGSTNSASVTFNGCTNLTFTFSYTNNTITRTGPSSDC